MSSGRKRAEVDHLGVDALPHQLLRGFERDPDADRVADDGHVLARADDPRLADRKHVIVELGHVEMLAVEQLVLEEHDRVVGPDRGLEQALGVGRAVRADHHQPRHVRVPAAVILAVLGGDPRRGAVGPAEHDRAAHLPARHIIGLGRRIDDVVDRLHREVEGHELDDRPKAAHRRAGAETGKAIFGDRRVDDALGPELLEQILRDLVGALIFGDLLADHEHPLVAPHLLRHRVAQRLAQGHGDERRPVGHFGIVMGRGDIGDEVARGGLEHMRGRLLPRCGDLRYPLSRSGEGWGRVHAYPDEG